MRPLELRSCVDRPLKVLCLGAHCDDIEIGCGGTVRHLIESHEEVEFAWVVFASTAERKREALASAKDLLDGVAKVRVIIEAFRESYFPFVGDQIKDRFETLKAEFEPDLILTHHLADRHQDHRVIAELTHNTFRKHLILGYEIPKYDADLTPTNVYVPLTEEQADRKVRAILTHFTSQRSRVWFDESTFRALLRLRGLECNAQTRSAEGFHCTKLVLGGPVSA